MKKRELKAMIKATINEIDDREVEQYTKKIIGLIDELEKTLKGVNEDDIDTWVAKMRSSTVNGTMSQLEALIKIFGRMK